MAGEKERARRYAVNIPAIMFDGTRILTGVVENLSSSGTLVTHASARPDVGAQGRLLLTDLRLSLRTSGPDSIELPVKVARHDPAGFAVQFTGPSEEVRTLIGRL